MGTGCRGAEGRLPGQRSLRLEVNDGEPSAALLVLKPPHGLRGARPPAHVLWPWGRPAL